MPQSLTVRGNTCVIGSGNPVRCAVGRSGYTVAKEEGDGGTPVGTWPVRQVFFRSDRLSEPTTGMDVVALSPDDGWCDDPADPLYNCAVKLPYKGRHETLWRVDHVYDIIVVLGYNDDPVLPGKGSAIFMHLARPDFSPTEGCVAVTLGDLHAILQQLGPGSVIEILGDE